MGIGAGFIAAVFLWWAPALSADSLAVLAARADLSCVRFRVTGVCRRNTPPYVGAQVRYWQPVLMVETVKVPGDSVIDEAKGMLGSLRRRDAEAGGGSSKDGSVLQMNEAHVFGFPLTDLISSLVEAPCEGVPEFSGLVSYLSEMDAVEWREGRQEQKHPLSRITAKMAPACDQAGTLVPWLCLGVWGPLYPRQGFLVHYSAEVGSAVAAYRAVDIASFNVLSPHRTLAPVLFMPNMMWDELQMVYPYKSQCFKIGTPPMFWENRRVSPEGRYVWVYWRKKECCLF